MTRARFSRTGSNEDEQAFTTQLVSVGAGRLALSHRPGRAELYRLPQLGCTHVVTVQSANEHAERLGQTLQGFGLRWTWLPVPNGKYPRGEAHDLLAAALPLLSSYLDDGDSILIHCAAGIHRTGMLAYGLLRWRGCGKAEALDLIAQMRAHTRNGMHPRHVLWGDNVIAGIHTPPPDDDAVLDEIFEDD